MDTIQGKVFIVSFFMHYCQKLTLCMKKIVWNVLFIYIPEVFARRCGLRTKKLKLICKKLNTHPTVISNILLPTELETAMSPNPFLATMTLVMRSGILVPAAKIVRPITWKIVIKIILSFVSCRSFPEIHVFSSIYNIAYQ